MQNKMGHEPIFRLIMKMAIPSMFSMMVQALYNIVDSIYVARVSEDALTSVSLVFPLQTFLIAVAVGTGVGINSYIARSLGARKQEDANHAATNGIFLAGVSSVVFFFIGLFAVEPFMMLFYENAAIHSMGVSYATIVLCCSFTIFTQIAIEKIFQGTGNMIYPMFTLILGAITNIVLDPIFIFGYFGLPAMGVTGAAIATVIGQFVAMALAIILLIKKNHAVKISFRGFRPKLYIIKQIYSVGVPSMIMQTVASFLITLLNGILIGFSGAAVSVLGIYFKLQSFFFMPIFGINQGLMPIMGYNFGAGNKERLTKTLKIGVMIALCLMITGFVIFFFFTDLLLNLFNPTDAVREIGTSALKIISIAFPLAGVNIIVSTFYQSIGKGFYSMYVSVLRQLLAILPMAYFFSSKFGVNGVWMSFPLSEAFASVLVFVLYIYTYKKHVAHLIPLGETQELENKI